MNYIIFIKNDGEIDKVEFSRGADNPPEGLRESDGLYIKHLETIGSYSPPKFIERHYYNFISNVFKEREEKPFPVAKWDSYIEEWTCSLDNYLRVVREERNMKLYACDWTQAIDSPLTDEKKAEWVAYRTKLRNITDQILPMSGPFLNFTQFVQWPEEPEN